MKVPSVRRCMAALDLAVLNRLQGSDRRPVCEICQRHLGDLMDGKGQGGDRG
ncbi:MAG: hypothetical protein ACYS8L_00480 [Planctomycetota bacterium]